MRTKHLFIMAIILLLTIIIGCQTSANKKPLTPNNNQYQDNQSNNGLQINNDRNNQADTFEKIAEQVPGVKNATVFISNPDNLSADEINIINTRNGQTPGMVGNTRVNNNNMDVNTNNRNSNQNMIVMVALELDKNRTMSKDNKNIENMVSEKIKNSDSRVYQVIATADAGMVRKIINLTNRADNTTNNGNRSGM